MADRPAVKRPEKMPPKWIFKLISRMHIFLNRITFGKFFNTLSGKDVCFVTMTGAKSGRRITMPLMWVPYGEGVLLVASQGGAPKHPAWYHNIVKHPDVAVRHRGKVQKLSARVADDAEKLTLWPICDSYFAPYADYRKRTARDIPVFVYEPAR
jgi:F420H(2)-dependent quinone reductase